MIFIRGHRWDYDRWAQLGATGWDYESVLPYFRRLEDNERGADAWRGTGGPIGVSENRATYPIVDDWIEAATEAGIPRSPDLNGRLAEGVDYIQVSQSGGLRCSAARGYLENLRPAQAPEVLLQTEVRGIVFENGRAVGVACRRDGEDRILRARHGVVLCAGAINTPRLLMRSGIGPAAHLRDMGIVVVQDLPGVGANLQEHVGVHVVSDVRTPTLNDDARGWRGALQVMRMAMQRRGALTTAIGHAQAFVSTRPGLPAPNLQICFGAFAFDLDERGRLSLRRHASTTTLIGLMRPATTGSVTLRSPDPTAPPRISFRMLDADDDIEQLREGIELARRILAQPAMARHGATELRPGAAAADAEALRSYIRANAIPLLHPVGTARIGTPGDPCAVVGPDLRVMGVEGLWVADASVMPSLPAGNTNATAIMIGDKGADHVLQHLKQGDNGLTAAPRAGSLGNVNACQNSNDC